MGVTKPIASSPDTGSAESLTSQSPADGSKKFVDSYLLYLLAAASERASAQFHSKVRDCGLRVPEWRVLAILVDRDGAMITRLAEFALIEQSRLTRIIDQMDERGLVRRKSDSNDKRRVRVYISAKGRRIATSLMGQAREHESSLLESLAGSDADALKPMLKTLLQKL